MIKICFRRFPFKYHKSLNAEFISRAKPLYVRGKPKSLPKLISSDKQDSKRWT